MPLLLTGAPLLLLLGNAAEEKAPPVIDLDGTIFIQLGLFVIMYVVLRRFLFTPYLEMRRLRTAGIEGVQQEAAKMEARAQELGEDYDRRIRAARLRSDDERLKLRAEGLDRERELLGRARGVAQSQLQATREQIARETQVASQDLQRQAQPLARQIASKILGREV